MLYAYEIIRNHKICPQHLINLSKIVLLKAQKKHNIYVALISTTQVTLYYKVLLVNISEKTNNI